MQRGVNCSAHKTKSHGFAMQQNVFIKSPLTPREEQEEAARKISAWVLEGFSRVQKRASIIGGPPGAGKTFTAQLAMAAISKSAPDVSYMLFAPNKAVASQWVASLGEQLLRVESFEQIDPDCELMSGMIVIPSSRREVTATNGARATAIQERLIRLLRSQRNSVVLMDEGQETARFTTAGRLATRTYFKQFSALAAHSIVISATISNEELEKLQVHWDLGYENIKRFPLPVPKMLFKRMTPDEGALADARAKATRLRPVLTKVVYPGNLSDVDDHGKRALLAFCVAMMPESLPPVKFYNDVENTKWVILIYASASGESVVTEFASERADVMVRSVTADSGVTLDMSMEDFEANNTANYLVFFQKQQLTSGVNFRYPVLGAFVQTALAISDANIIKFTQISGRGNRFPKKSSRDDKLTEHFLPCDIPRGYIGLTVVSTFTDPLLSDTNVDKWVELKEMMNIKELQDDLVNAANYDPSEPFDDSGDAGVEKKGDNIEYDHVDVDYDDDGRDRGEVQEVDRRVLFEQDFNAQPLTAADPVLTYPVMENKKLVWLRDP